MRSIVFWAHLVVALTGGMVVLIMSVTGVALTYQRQMQYWADAGAYRVEPPGPDATPLELSALLTRVREQAPDANPTTVTWRRTPTEPAAVAAGPRTLYVNPYTGDVLGEPQGQRLRAFFSTMVSWHRCLAMSGERRATGRAITGAANLGFLVLVLSGFYLWWPRHWTWTQFRNVLWFRRRLTPKARDFNWHHVIGYWSGVPLAIVAYAGVVISYPWASNLVYRVVGEQPPAPAAAASRQAGGAAPPLQAPIDRAVAHARAHDPEWRILTMRLAAAGAPASFTIDRGDGGQPQLRGTLTLDATPGDLVRWESFADQSNGRRVRS